MAVLNVDFLTVGGSTLQLKSAVDGHLAMFVLDLLLSHIFAEDIRFLAANFREVRLQVVDSRSFFDLTPSRTDRCSKPLLHGEAHQLPARRASFTSELWTSRQWLAEL